MNKVCIVTAARSEYGLLRWLLEEVKNDEQLELRLVVTGTHLSPEYGLTYLEIEKDGFKIDEKVDISVSSSLEGIVKSMGICSIGFADAFSRLKPDILIVLGDRYELLPICGAALIMRIPIAHISGGDVTEGAIDDEIRNAITMMASIHFPGVKESADRIKKMRGTGHNIYCVGEPGLDNFKHLQLWSRKKLAENLSLNISQKWVLMTYHPETKLSLETNLLVVKNILSALDELENIQVIITGANADFGGNEINNLLKEFVAYNNLKYKFFNSLGQIRYLSLIKEIDFVIGNSSSGIVEAPFAGKRVVNVGDRQKGRYISQNIVNCSGDRDSITSAIDKVLRIKAIQETYYGDGNSAGRIKNKILYFLTK